MQDSTNSYYAHNQCPTQAYSNNEHNSQGLNGPGFSGPTYNPTHIQGVNQFSQGIYSNQGFNQYPQDHNPDVKPIQTTMSSFDISYDTARNPITGTCDHESTSSRSKFRRVAQYLCATWILISFIQLIVLLVQFRFGKSGATIDGAIDGISNNLRALPFSDIVFPNNSTNCPSDYQAASLGKWPGTESFCDDPILNSEKKTGSNKNKCKKKISAKGSAFYHVWKSTSACIKPVNFLNTSTCPSGYTKCTVGVCVEGTDCPITQMKVQSTPDNATGWLNTSFPDGKYLNFRKDEGVPPIVSLELDLGSPTPCVNVNELPIQKNYEAILISGYGCSTPGQFAGATTLDEDTAYNAFKSQSWASSVLSLPRFNETLQDQKAYLMAIPRIQLKDVSGCTDFNLHTLTAGGDGLSEADSLTTILTLLSLGFFGFAIMCLWVFFGHKHVLKRDWPFLLALCLFVVGLSVVAVLAPLNIKKNQESVLLYVADIERIENSQCFTETSLNAVMTQYLSGASALSRVVALWSIYEIVFFVTLAPAVVGMLYHLLCHGSSK